MILGAGQRLGSLAQELLAPEVGLPLLVELREGRLAPVEERVAGGAEALPGGVAVGARGRTDLLPLVLVAFDERGYRVGYGKGYYDRFLAKCKPTCFKVGLSFFPPLEMIEDVHEYDVPLDLCIMRDGVWRRDG